MTTPQIPFKKLRFRQVHLDFHTSPLIPDIGVKFDRKQWQDTLQSAAVDSITLFSKCHHGVSYHPTRIGEMHPHLKFDLLRAQVDACQEIGIATPVYLSAGVDNFAAERHPEWREIDAKGGYVGWPKSPLEAGFMTLDFHSPYLDYLCAQIEEAVELFPEADGIFLDIIAQWQSCSVWALKYMAEHGLDATKEEDRKKSSHAALLKYYERTTAAARSRNPNMPVFHNYGHIERGRPEMLVYQSHLELESLPTGGWGYDHFPSSAKYVINLPHDFLGMTGKFHTTWGEFGGYKHPNALRYECAAMLAFGSKCSVGDQLHPDGALDASTYGIIGEAYREVRAKEAYCSGARPVADIGVLSSEAESGDRTSVDDGVSRVLLEGHELFVFLDRQMDFSPYRLLILPDNIRVDAGLQAKVEAFLAGGGKLMLTGESGLTKAGDAFVFDLGAEPSGPGEFQPDYVLPIPELRAPFVQSPLVMYTAAQRIKATTGRSLGQIYHPYFNRAFNHFSSHQHAPPRPEASGFDCGVENGAILYLAHPVFTLYRGLGAVPYKEYALRAVRRILGLPTLRLEGLPSTGRVSLMHQPAAARHVLHLLGGQTVNRGGEMKLSGGNISSGARSVEVIEDLPELQPVRVRLHLPKPPARVTLEPRGQSLEFQRNGDAIRFTAPAFACHQMIVLHER